MRAITGAIICFDEIALMLDLTVHIESSSCDVTKPEVCVAWLLLLTLRTHSEATIW